MTVEKIKEMLDACYQAKRIRDMLPALPAGVTPSYIQYLDVIENLERRGVRVKISDISSALGLPRPGVTRTVKEMENKGYLTKIASAEDGRIIYISMTESGKQLSYRYNEQYFSVLALHLTDISEEDADCMIRIMEKFYRGTCEWRDSFYE